MASVKRILSCKSVLLVVIIAFVLVEASVVESLKANRARSLAFKSFSTRSGWRRPRPRPNQSISISSRSRNRNFHLQRQPTRFLQEDYSPEPALAPPPARKHHKTLTPPPVTHSAAPAPAPATTADKKKDDVPTKKWGYGLLMAVIAGAASAGLCCFVFRAVLYFLYRLPKPAKVQIYSSLIKSQDLEFLEAEDFDASSTGGRAQLIGKGGFGEVYRCELTERDKQMIKHVAVKKSHLNSRGSDLSDEDSKLLDKKRRSIKAELDTLAQVRHKNLVALFAYVPRNKFHLVVYQYMTNGSLRDAMKRVADGELELPWRTRHKIALGIAAGLEYLHFQSKAKIIHRDLTPANILLDEDFDAKVADFGLAKALPDAATHASTSNVAGTVGYIAPEYHQTLKFTDKCDIYSFGVVLAFLFTGKEPCDEFFQQRPAGSIPQWLRGVVAEAATAAKSADPSEQSKPNAAIMAIDPTLRGHGHEDDIFLMLKIACFCTYDDPHLRPNSKDVVTMISQIKV